MPVAAQILYPAEEALCPHMQSAKLPTSISVRGVEQRQQYLSLAEIWTAPDSGCFYGLDTQGAWWRFNLTYLRHHRQFYVLDSFHLSGAPDLSGLERVK